MNRLIDYEAALLELFDGDLFQQIIDQRFQTNKVIHFPFYYQLNIKD